MIGSLNPSAPEWQAVNRAPAASLIPGMLYERPIAFEAIRQVLLRKIRECAEQPPFTGQIRRAAFTEILDMIEYGASHGH